MSQNAIIISIFLIFAGAAVLSTIALYTRQSLLVAYMILGIILGPWGLQWVANADDIQKIGDVGIVFLLFLLGLHLQPQSLLHLLKKVSWVALVSSIIFWIVGFGFAWLFHFPITAAAVVGAAMMFSSTIIGLKLLPTTVLHHQHTGEIMIGILLLQDLIAILVLIFLHGFEVGQLKWLQLLKVSLSVPLLILFSFLASRYVLIKLFSRFDRIREYMFLLAIAWCLSIAELAYLVGLSSEVGAFIAGVTIAAHPISLYIAESLKPVRDFFLVLFFFAVGANFDLTYFNQIALPAILLAVIFLLIKPVVFKFLLRQVGEPKHVAWEIGVRLAQMSEFSLLIAYLTVQSGLVDQLTSNLIEIATMITFMVSSYLVVFRYPTPVALSDRLRRD